MNKSPLEHIHDLCDSYYATHNIVPTSVILDKQSYLDLKNSMHVKERVYTPSDPADKSTELMAIHGHKGYLSVVVLGSYPGKLIEIGHTYGKN